MPYIGPADIRARVPSTIYVQLFDMDQDGVVNESSGPDFAALTQAINASQSVVDTELIVGFPEGLAANGGVVDERIKGAQVQVALYEAVRYGPLADGSASSVYRAGYDDAIRMFARLRKADGINAVTGANGAPSTKRVGEVQNTINDAYNKNTDSFSRVANGRDPSVF